MINLEGVRVTVGVLVDVDVIVGVRLIVGVELIVGVGVMVGVLVIVGVGVAQSGSDAVSVAPVQGEAAVKVNLTPVLVDTAPVPL